MMRMAVCVACFYSGADTYQLYKKSISIRRSLRMPFWAVCGAIA